MCWIAGILSKTPIHEDSLFLACEKMWHRWPDAKAYWKSSDWCTHLWHVRLSIVDPDPRSTQPFSIDNGAYTIIFNGEIYNYRKLRASLEKSHNIVFTTTSDTEVLIHLYAIYGAWCLELIEGMFAFAIFDKRKGETFIARDFTWQKPLMYSETPTGVYFASEIPALFCLSNDISREINMDVLGLYLVENFSHIPPPLSLYLGVKKLPNASYMIVAGGKVTKIQSYARLTKTWISSSVGEVEFLDSILDEMRPSDVWYASFLSGGIDSSYICSVLKNHETSPTEAYTLKIPWNDDDYRRAQFVAKKFDLVHHTTELWAKNLLNSVDETIKNIGEPYFHITSVYADLILQEAKKQHRVFFTWAGWDECYYGYDNIQFIILDIYFRISKYVPHLLKKFIDFLTWRRFSCVIFSSVLTFKLNYYTSNFKKIAHLLKNPNIPTNTIKKITDTINEFVIMDNYVDTSYMYGLFIENLHSLTLQGDVIGMKNSIEIRSLFLEKRVIERSYSIPFWKKISLFRLREGKEILRKWLGKILGKDFVYEKKIGFGVHFDFISYFQENYLEKIKSVIQNLEKRDIFVPWISKLLFKDFRKNFFLIMKLYAIEKTLEYNSDF